MPYNLPQYSSQKFSIGPCVVYMGDFTTSAGPPLVDVGAIEAGATLTTTREKVEVFQGFPE